MLRVEFDRELQLIFGCDIAGLFQGSFVLPMTLTREWKWEHTWAAFSLLGMLVFNWLIAGTDAHAKNYGLVLSATNARLAPLYDVASALVMPEWNWHKWELAMHINKQGRFKYLRIEDWKKFATSANVDFGVIETAIAGYSSALVESVADAARPMDLDVDERAFAARFTDALAEHTSRVVGR